MPDTGHILIVDDDWALNQMLCMHFEDRGLTVDSATDCAEARSRVASCAPDIVLLDQYLPDGKGLDLLPELLRSDPGLAVIMMTGQSDLELAMTAISEGALDFIHKPVKTDELNHVVDRALERRRLLRQVAASSPTDTQEARSRGLVGRSQAMLDVSKQIARVASTDAPVLITGESGTGKELVARAIHAHSRRTGPFIAVNSAAIVETLLESELFGHERGAFTGAVSRKLGKFELARDGTLFLDEIGELPLSMQAKLLRVLQENTFERVGGNQQIRTNARILTATNRDLGRQGDGGRFRNDLLFRLQVLRIDIPPLRERREDIPPLCATLLGRIARTLHRPALELSKEAFDVLAAHDWPGNVRELENALTQAAVRATSPMLTPDLFALPGATGPASAAPSPTPDTPMSLDEVEAAHVQAILDRVMGHKGRACGILGISRPALDRKIRKYGLRVTGNS